MNHLLHLILYIGLWTCSTNSWGQATEDSPFRGSGGSCSTNSWGQATLSPNQDENALPTQLHENLKLTPQQADSLAFRLTHHFSENFNFAVTTDSIVLIPREGDLLLDTCTIYRDEIIAVAAIRHTSSLSTDSAQTDTVWLKVASSQHKMGWITEVDLLPNVMPDEPLSRLLHTLHAPRTRWVLLAISLSILTVGILLTLRRHKRTFFLSHLRSFFPPLLLMLTAALAVMCKAVHTFSPEFGIEYYYHPTLNPLILPPAMSAVLVLVWLIAIVYIAVIIDLYNQLNFLHSMVFLFKITGLTLFVYLLFAWIPLFIPSAILFVLLTVFLIIYYYRNIRPRFLCGNCGAMLQHRGLCPQCGTLNE